MRIVAFFALLASLSLGWAIGCARHEITTRNFSEIPRIAFLSSGTRQEWHEQFLLGLQELGYVPGESIEVGWMYAEGDEAALNEIVQNAVDRGFQIIVANDTRTTLAAKRATSDVPIVMVSSGDPVGAGLVASLPRPGGNVTGLTTLSKDLAAKRLEVLKEIAPTVSYIGVFGDPSNPIRATEWNETEIAGRNLGVSTLPLAVSYQAEIQPAFESAVADGVDAFVVFGDNLFGLNRDTFFELSRQYMVPVMYEGTQWVEQGGLAAYSPSIAERYRRAATYVDKILKGARPKDLPIEGPINFDLAINVRTAEALGLTIPESIIMRATRVVQ